MGLCKDIKQTAKILSVSTRTREIETTYIGTMINKISQKQIEMIMKQIAYKFENFNDVLLHYNDKCTMDIEIVLVQKIKNLLN